LFEACKCDYVTFRMDSVEEYEIRPGTRSNCKWEFSEMKANTEQCREQVKA